MNNGRFQQIETLIEDAGRCFDPVTGQFEPLDGTEDDESAGADFDLDAFLAALGITEDECTEYVQRKVHEYDESLRNA